MEVQTFIGVGIPHRYAYGHHFRNLNSVRVGLREKYDDDGTFSLMDLPSHSSPQGR